MLNVGESIFDCEAWNDYSTPERWNSQACNNSLKGCFSMQRRSEIKDNRRGIVSIIGKSKTAELPN